jgi:hypothetical protein
MWQVHVYECFQECAKDTHGLHAFQRCAQPTATEASHATVTTDMAYPGQQHADKRARTKDQQHVHVKALAEAHWPSHPTPREEGSDTWKNT